MHGSLFANDTPVLEANLWEEAEIPVSSSKQYEACCLHQGLNWRNKNLGTWSIDRTKGKKREESW
jgi:hypothetical protein